MVTLAKEVLESTGSKKSFKDCRGFDGGSEVENCTPLVSLEKLIQMRLSRTVWLVSRSLLGVWKLKRGEPAFWDEETVMRTLMMEPRSLRGDGRGRKRAVSHLNSNDLREAWELRG
jgi:hypothetical protein